jgi:Cu-Zn family superoxide dismutase
MKLRLPARVAIVALVLSGAAVALAVAPAEGAPTARAVLRDVNGAAIGTLELKPTGTQLVVTGTFRLAPSMAGWHGFHIHSVGVCDAAGAFASAGGHLGSSYPVAQVHGHHDGDMPSLFVMPDGTATVEFRTSGHVMDSIFDGDGAAVIVHAAPDNFANIPTRYAPGGPDAATFSTGDAGARVLCGVLGR